MPAVYVLSTNPQQKNNKGLKKYLSSPVNVPLLVHELKKHPDKQFTHYLLSGLKQGFDPGLESLPDATVVCKNFTICPDRSRHRRFPPRKGGEF